MSEIRHKIEYSASGVPLSDVISALQSHQRLLPKAVNALTALAPGAEIRVVRITVDEIRAGSLIFDLLLELYGVYQHDVDRVTVEGIESLLGVDVPKEYEALVTLMMIGVVFFVSRWAYDTVKSKKNEPAPGIHITGDYNRVINIIAGKLQITANEVEGAIAQAVQPSRVRTLINAVAAFFRPARTQPGSTIKGGGFEVSPDAIAEFPSEADLKAIDETEMINLPDTLIDIRALDKDRGERGWAAKIVGRPDFDFSRLPMDLYPTVNAPELAKLDKVRADLVVEMKRDGSGELRPKRLHLLAYREIETPPK